MLLCAQVNMEDFYVIHHEMGHVQYYMAYKDMPAIFQASSLPAAFNLASSKSNYKTEIVILANVVGRS